MAATVDRMTQQTPAAPTPPTAPEWFQGITRTVVLAVGAVALLALAGWFTLASRQRKEAYAQRALAAARDAAQAANFGLASSQLQKIITTYSGTDAAQEAVITLNQVRLVNDQRELGIVGLQDFVKANPSPKFAAPANGLLASALENANRPAQAAPVYEAASKAADLPYLKADYLLSAGRAWVNAGKPDEAVRVFRSILKDYPEAPGSTEAQVRLAELTKGKM